MKLGIDFGTTNSAVAVIDRNGNPRTIPLFDGEPVQRTVIYASPEGRVSFGNAAFRDYLAHDLEGRFLRSIKAFLAQDVPNTTLAGKRYTFPELITAYLRFLMERVEAVTDEPVTEVTVGRPVRFHADPIRDAKAVARLSDAVNAAGIPNWRLQLEPIAAAHFYEHDIPSERIVLVGDFGGGTSDFAVLRVGPQRTGNRLDDVLGTSGVAKAGDVLDGRFMDTFLLDWFGRGARITPRYQTTSEPWDHPVLQHIQALFTLPMLRSQALKDRLNYVETHIDRPDDILRVRHLVFDDLGFPMAWAIEASKRELSSGNAIFRFDDFMSDRLNFQQSVDLPTYANGCETLLREYDQAVNEVLAAAGLQTADIDDVFLTGGSAQLPFIRDRFAQRFGVDRLHSANAFTSVCEGLALS